MKSTKPIGPTEINKSSSEMDVEENIRELTRARPTFRQAENADDETSANSLDTLLGRVSEASTRETKRRDTEALSKFKLRHCQLSPSADIKT